MILLEIKIFTHSSSIKTSLETIVCAKTIDRSLCKILPRLTNGKIVTQF